MEFSRPCKGLSKVWYGEHGESYGSFQAVPKVSLHVPRWLIYFCSLLWWRRLLGQFPPAPLTESPSLTLNLHEGLGRTVASTKDDVAANLLLNTASYAVCGITFTMKRFQIADRCELAFVAATSFPDGFDGTLRTTMVPPASKDVFLLLSWSRFSL